MSKQAPERKRCSECRQWFHPAGSAAKHQVVCGPECRKTRNRRLARERRSRSLQDHRVEERERQRRCRERRRASGSASRSRASPEGSRHAQASGLNLADLQAKVEEVCDRVARESRASLQREIPVLVRGWLAAAGTGG